MQYYPKQGDYVFMSAEPHAGHEIGGHEPKKNNIRRPYLILSRESFNKKTGMVYGMAITSKCKKSPFRIRIMDVKSRINGDLLLDKVPEYDFIARNGEIIGHIADEAILEQALTIFLQTF